MLPTSDTGLFLPLGLLGLFAMSFLGSGPVPIPFPITVTILWMAQFDFPVAVVLTTTAGSVFGWMFLERYYRQILFRWPRLQKSIPASYQKFFLRKTGLWLFLFNALPFPWDPMRLLAMLNHYDRRRLLVIFGAARLIRNGMLVTIGTVLAPYKLWFWAAILVFLLVPVLLERLLKRFFETVPVPD